MHIHHVAIWAQDLEALTTFYCTLFGGQANERYHNQAKQFSSYFVRFEGGASLELMHTPILFPADLSLPHPLQGLAHLAFSLGSVEAVDKMTARLKLLKGAEVKHLDGPRWTGDGYYESTFLDPEGNRLELTT
ncbi:MULTISPECIES: VOC family protein [unclassified Aeromonas]|uniref:VOC family protein n=1 Tax=unclassified Aeromonas TaxID=257493 RepID=UPI0035288FEA